MILALALVTHSPFAHGLVAPPPPSQAALAAQADALILQGNQLRAAGRDEDALPLYQRAVEIYRTPRAAAQLGLAQQANGLWDLAIVNIGEALNTPDDPWVQHNLAALEQARTEVLEHVARLTVTTNLESAELFVGGRMVTRLPMTQPVYVLAGEVRYSLRAPGYATVERMVVLRPRELITQHVQLEENQTVLRPRAIASSTSPTPASTDVVAPQPPRPAPAVAQWHRPVTTALFVEGGLGIALGVVASIVRESAVQSVLTDPSCYAFRVPIRDACYDRSLNAEATYHRADTLSIVGFVLGSASLAGGVVLLLTQPREHATTRAGIACAPAMGAGVQCTGVF